MAFDFAFQPNVRAQLQLVQEHALHAGKFVYVSRVVVTFRKAENNFVVGKESVDLLAVFAEKFAVDAGMNAFLEFAAKQFVAFKADNFSGVSPKFRQPHLKRLKQFARALKEFFRRLAVTFQISQVSFLSRRGFVSVVQNCLHGILPQCRRLIFRARFFQRVNRPPRLLKQIVPVVDLTLQFRHQHIEIFTVARLAFFNGALSLQPQIVRRLPPHVFQIALTVADNP